MKKEMDQSKEGVAVTRTQRRTVNDTRVKLKANAVGARIITAKTEMTPPLLVTYDEDRSPTPLSWEKERERERDPLERRFFRILSQSSQGQFSTQRFFAKEKFFSSPLHALIDRKEKRNKTVTVLRRMETLVKGF